MIRKEPIQCQFLEKKNWTKPIQFRFSSKIVQKNRFSSIFYQKWFEKLVKFHFPSKNILQRQFRYMVTFSIKKNSKSRFSFIYQKKNCSKKPAQFHFPSLHCCFSYQKNNKTDPVPFSIKKNSKKNRFSFIYQKKIVQNRFSSNFHQQKLTS